MKRHTYPWLTASVTAVTIAVYSVLEQGLSHPPTNAVLRQDGAITAWGHLHLWAPVLAIFLHVSLVHVLSNMVVLVLVGTFLEREISRWVWVFTYFASGIAGNLVQSLLLHPHDLASGASGAIMGLLAMLAAIWFRRRNRENWPRLAALLLLAGLEFVGEFQDPAHIAMAAHVGGVAVGLALGCFVPARTFRPPTPSAVPAPVVQGRPSVYGLAREAEPAVLQIACDTRRLGPRWHLYVDGAWRGDVSRRAPFLGVPVEPGIHLVVFSGGWDRRAFHVVVDAGQAVIFHYRAGWFLREPRMTWKTASMGNAVLREEASNDG